MPPAPTFSRTARLALQAARREAGRSRDTQVGTDHLLLGLTAPVGSDSARALESLGISEAQVQARFMRERRWRVEGMSPGDYSTLAHSVVKDALSAAESRGDPEAGSGDLLLSLARHRRTPGGRFLVKLGVTPAAVALALGQAAEPVDLGVSPATSPQPSEDGPDRRGQDSAAVEISVQRTRTVNAAADRAWELASTPRAWSLSLRSLMFEVPDADGLWFYLGPVPGWSDFDTMCIVFAPATSQARRELAISARTPPTGLSFTVSVHPGLAADWAEVRLTAVMRVRAGRQGSVSVALRNDLDDWLSALDRALAATASWPCTGPPPPLLTAWAAEPVIEQPRTSTASLLIAARPEVVWDVVRRPWQRQVDPAVAVIHTGRIPGTPAGEPGEAWYSIHRHADGVQHAAAQAATRYADGRLAVMHDIASGATWPLRRTYRLAAEAGQTRLEVESRWAAAMTVGRQDRAALLTASAHRLASRCKAAAESTQGSGDGPTGA